MIRPRTTNPGIHVGPPRPSSADIATRVAHFLTEWWKWALAIILGVVALAAGIAAYSAWSGKTETDSATLLRKAVSHLEASSRAGSDAVKQDEGLRLLQEVMNRYPKSTAAAEAALRLGNHYYVIGQYHEARTVYTTYLNANPKGEIAFSAGLGLGDTYLAERNYEKAVEAYSKLLERFAQEPLLPEAQLHLAKAYLGANRSKDATALYEKVVATYPNTGWAQAAQAELYRLGLTSR